MPKPPADLPSGVRPTDILTVAQFASVFPIESVREALDECGVGTVRVRHLPSEAVVYFVMMLALFRDCNHREVFRCVAQALRDLFRGFFGVQDILSVIPTASALSQSRTRIKHEPFQKLFERHAKPLATKDDRGCYFKNLRKTAIDGSLINTDDTPANREFFGHSKNQVSSKARAPQVRFVGLMEVGTHAFFKAAIGTYHDGEITLAQELVPWMSSDMIVLADRNFYSFELYRAISQRGAKLLFRIQRGMSFKPDRQLSDGSYLVTVFSPDDTTKANGLQARFFQYQVKGAKTNEMYFMLTNILDPALAKAEELAGLYCERWEYETALDEIKTHLNVKSLILRSKTPELVMQELWGLLMTHYAIRKVMYMAACHKSLDPDRMSFIHTIRVVKRALVNSGVFFPEESDDGAAV